MRITERRQRLLLAGALPVFLAGLVAAGRATSGMAAGTCRHCHTSTPAWQTWHSSAHKQIACNQCHTQGLLHAAAERGKLPPAQTSPKPVAVPDAPCRRCHYGGGQVADAEMHRLHTEGEHVGCLRCHGSGAHEFGAAVGKCGGCHATTVAHVQEMGKEHCLACHAFKNEGGRETYDPAACRACHRTRGAAVSSGTPHLATGVPCGVCHRPHTAQPANANCATCHRAAVTATTPPMHRECANCHAPHSWKLTGAQQCPACHSPLPPVPAHRVAGHPQRFCLSCHPPHAWKFAGQKVCSDCHQRRKALPHAFPWVQGHQAPAKARPAFCQSCHPQQFCADCHSRMQPASHSRPAWAGALHGPTSRSDRQQCATCHASAFCSNCHAKTMPASHASADWPVSAHIATSTTDGQACVICHGTSACADCHSRTKPPSHRQSGWAGARHGSIAAKNPDECAVCHQTAFCNGCHGLPMPHPKHWIQDHPAADQRLCAHCHAQAFCRRCHSGPNRMPPDHASKWGTRHGKVALQRGMKTCFHCHWELTCTNCHGIQMPHPKGWLAAGHAAKGTFAADGVCLTCHKIEFCRTCHPAEKAGGG